MTAELIGIHRNTSRVFYHRLWQIVVKHLDHGLLFVGPIEVAESYFDGRRKGKRGLGAAGKVPVFSILQRGDRVYTQIIPKARSKTLMPIMEKKIVSDRIAIVMPCLVTMPWMWPHFGIFGLIIRRVL